MWLLENKEEKIIPQEYYKKHNTQKYHDLFKVSEYNAILCIAKFCEIILALHELISSCN